MIIERISHPNLSERLINSIRDSIVPYLASLKETANKHPRLHYMRNGCDEGGFKISKVAHFQKQTYLTTSMTTDGSFLYIIVSAANGGMYKIGTGERDTVPGKVYLYSALSKQEDVCWVYVKGKLYLRSSSREVKKIS